MTLTCIKRALAASGLLLAVSAHALPASAETQGVSSNDLLFSSGFEAE